MTTKKFENPSQINIVVEQAFRDKLSKLAYDLDVPLSKFIREAIRYYLRHLEEETKWRTP